MVSKIDLGILGLGALAVFLIVRGAGQKLDKLTNPLADIKFPDVGAGLGSIGEGITDFFGGIKIPEVFGSPDSTTDQSAVSIGQIEDRPVPIDLIPTEDERLRGNESILQNLGLSPSVVDTPITNIADFINRFVPSIPQVQAEEQVIPASIPFAINEGGGPSFIGGGIFETPIENLSLSQIIDKFNVTASQAANIQAEAQDNFGDFDFGTNTGSGLGSITTRDDINTQLSAGNVSNPDFEGLSATEIAQLLTGGNINNF